MNTSFSVTPNLGFSQPPEASHAPVGEPGDGRVGADFHASETPSRVFTVAQTTGTPGAIGFSSSPAPSFRDTGMGWEAPKRRMESIMEAMERNEFDPSDAKAPWVLLELQNAIQEVGMEIEIASKVVEHATSATKTVLQTQA